MFILTDFLQQSCNGFHTLWRCYRSLTDSKQYHLSIPGRLLFCRHRDGSLSKSWKMFFFWQVLWASSAHSHLLLRLKIINLPKWAVGMMCAVLRHAGCPASPAAPTSSPAWETPVPWTRNSAQPVLLHQPPRWPSTTSSRSTARPSN